MAQNLRALRKFIEAHEDIALIFPVHPNPAVCAPAQDILSGHRRIILTKPLEYEDFIILLRNAWLIVSDSGGVQEEAPTLGKPLLILRENTERPEVLESGIARLVGGQVETLTRMLEEAYSDEGWNQRVRRVANPFGSGDSGARIAGIIEEILTGNTSLTADKAEIDGNLMRDIAG
jgi:UDP-N-acetylglucosamine 2-epimerase (non-hydrolysing)